MVCKTNTQSELSGKVRRIAFAADELRWHTVNHYLASLLFSDFPLIGINNEFYI